MSTATPKYFTTKEVSQITGFAVATLNGWRTNGGGPLFLKLDHAVRYKESDLLAWMEGKTCSSTSEYDTGCEGNGRRRKTASA